MILRYASPSLVMLGGVPGVGKSTLLQNLELEDYDVEVISADACRGLVQMDNGYDYDDYIEDCIPEARKLFFYSLGMAANHQRNIVAEASYLTAHSRGEMIQWAREHWYSPHLIVLYASLRNVREAQKLRRRSVPDSILSKHWENWERLTGELDDGVLDPGLSTAIMLGRSEVDCFTSIKFNAHA